MNLSLTSLKQRGVKVLWALLQTWFTGAERKRTVPQALIAIIHRMLFLLPAETFQHFCPQYQALPWHCRFKTRALLSSDTNRFILML